MIIVSQDDSRVLCNDIMMNAENGLRVNSNPRYLTNNDFRNEIYSIKFDGIMS